MTTEQEMQRVIDEAIDIGAHAGKEAMAALMRVINTLPTHRQKISALFIASGYLQHKIDGLEAIASVEPAGFNNMLMMTFESSRKAFAAASADTLAGLVASRAADIRKGQG